tara:strand:+ start:2023 stop:2913 length:891 start_codon:yes stop_codon:yes gene_type:complete
MFGGFKYNPAPSQVDPNLPVYKPHAMTLKGGKSSEEDQLAMQSHLAGGMLGGYQYRPLKNPTKFGTNPFYAITGQQPTNSQVAQAGWTTQQNTAAPAPSQNMTPMGLMNLPSYIQSGVQSSTQPTSGLPLGGPSIVNTSGVFGGSQVAPTTPDGVFVSDGERGDGDKKKKGPKGRYSVGDLMSFQSALDSGSNYAGLVDRDYIADSFDSHDDGTFSIKAGTNPFEAFGYFPQDGSGLVHWDDEEVEGFDRTRTLEERNNKIRANLTGSLRDFSGADGGSGGAGGGGEGTGEGGEAN